MGCVAKNVLQRGMYVYTGVRLCVIRVCVPISAGFGHNRRGHTIIVFVREVGRHRGGVVAD
jgi:hypothetical protein